LQMKAPSSVPNCMATIPDGKCTRLIISPLVAGLRTFSRFETTSRFQGLLIGGQGEYPMSRKANTVERPERRASSGPLYADGCPVCLRMAQSEDRGSSGECRFRSKLTYRRLSIRRRSSLPLQRRLSKPDVIRRRREEYATMLNGIVGVFEEDGIVVEEPTR
jgi:hypothetical protein